MRVHRMVTVLAASALSLTSLGAGAAFADNTNTAEHPVGTASTSLTALDLEVTGLGDVPGVTVLDVGSFASTDLDADRNTLGGGSPFAWVGATPLEAAGQTVGELEVRSDGQTGGSGQTIDFTDPTGTLDVLVNPVELSAMADTTDATGAAQALTAEVGVLAGALGLDLNTTGIQSSVSATAATATQGLRVGSLGLDLGDLVPAEVLGQLPIDTLIQLLELVPVDLDVDLQSLVDAVVTSVDALEQTLGELETAGQQLQQELDDFAATWSDETQESLEQAVTDAQEDLDAAEAELAELEADLQALQDDPEGNLADLLDKYATECGLDLTATVAELEACLEDLIDEAQVAVDDAQAALDDAIATLEAFLDDVEAVATALDALNALVNTLVDQLQQVVASLTDLQGSLGDVVAALADGELLDVGALDIGVVATATDALDRSNATVGCEPVPVSVVGVDLGTADCSAPLTAASDALAGALDTVEGILGTLPISQDVVPDVGLELFPTVKETVVEDGDYISSTAQVTVLDLDLPSVTIDPAEVVDGLLDTLAVQAEQLLDSALPESDTALADLGLTDLQTTLDGMLAQAPTVSDLQDQFDALLAELPDGSGLPTLSTPGLRAHVDPISSAQFAPAAAPEPPSDSPPPAAAPPPEDPDLPATGGGLATVGLLGIAGAFLLRRRR